MENISNDLVRWEGILKKEIRNLFILFSASDTKKVNEQINILENEMKTCEETLTNKESNQ